MPNPFMKGVDITVESMGISATALWLACASFVLSILTVQALYTLTHNITQLCTQTMPRTFPRLRVSSDSSLHTLIHVMHSPNYKYYG